jgi:hypothetical protein
MAVLPIVFLTGTAHLLVSLCKTDRWREEEIAALFEAAAGRYTGRGMTDVLWAAMVRDLNSKLRQDRPRTVAGVKTKLEQLVRCYNMVEKDRTGHNNDLWDNTDPLSIEERTQLAQSFHPFKSYTKALHESMATVMALARPDIPNVGLDGAVELYCA